MSKQVEVSRENPAAYLQAAMRCREINNDATLADALDDACMAVEENAPNAAAAFAAFCAALDERGIAVTALELSRAEKADERAYSAHIAKNPPSNRGKSYG